MYVPRPFQPTRAACLGFAQARGFGTVCAWDGRKPIAAAVPFCLEYAEDGTPQLAFHLAKNNPLLKLADGTLPFVMAVNGPDAYVSADWYASKDQVPTWLYQAVHLTGPAMVLSADELGPHLDQLSDKFEARLAPKPVWRSSKMTAGRLSAMKQAIVGVVMAVTEVEGAFKLNQHKSEADRMAVSDALSRQRHDGAQQIAAMMQEHLAAQADAALVQEGTM